MRRMIIELYIIRMFFWQTLDIIQTHNVQREPNRDKQYIICIMPMMPWVICCPKHILMSAVKKADNFMPINLYYRDAQ